MRRVSESAGEWSGRSIQMGMAAWDENPDQVSHFLGATGQSASLTGYLLGNVEVGSTAAGRSADERKELVIDIFAGALNAVPLPPVASGTARQIATFARGQLMNRGKEGITSDWVDSEATAQVRAAAQQRQARADRQLFAAQVLAGAENVPDWARLDPAVLADSEWKDRLNSWLTTGGADTTGLEVAVGTDSFFNDGLRAAGAGEG